MRFFLSGGTGYIGANLAIKLVGMGHTVHALVRDTEKAKSILHPTIKLFKGDLSDKSAIGSAMESCDGAFHLAAFARVWARDPATYFNINTAGTKNVLEKALECGVKKLVFTSTAGVLGPSYGKQPISEDSTRQIGFFNDYESSKALAENLVQKYNGSSLETVTVYPPRVYGPGEMSESNAVTKLVQEYIRGNWKLIPGDGLKTGCYAYIEDVTDGHVQAFFKGKPGNQYILGGENIDYMQLFSLIRACSGKDYALYKVPLPAMLAFGQFQVLREKVMGTPPLLTPQWVKKYVYNWSLSSANAIKDIDYKITPLKEGLQLTIDWLKENQKI